MHTKKERKKKKEKETLQNHNPGTDDITPQAWARMDPSDSVVPLDLHTACALGDYDCVRGHLAAGSDLTRLNAEGWSPLLYAAFLGHTSLVTLLLETSRCVVNARGRDGRSVLVSACVAGHDTVVKQLRLQIAGGAAVSVVGHGF
jgi:ankyrin repeat protein